MQVDYKKLWILLIEKEIKNKTDLIPLAGISANILAKLNKGEFAEDYPDCLKIIEKKVKPERTRLNDEGTDFALRKPLPQRWWQYADKRPALYSKLATMQRTLVVAQVSKPVAFAFLNTNQVLDTQLIVFPF